VALILLVTVSLIAMLFDIWPVLFSALSSALIWNYFFIPPIFTFHINDTEDLLMFLLYFLIALVNAVLTFKIRKEENKARDQAEKEKTIQLYNTLLNSLSHELRTPISTILGAVDTLKETKQKLSMQNQEELLNQIDIASIRLNRQVENLLNMSRLETGMLKLNLTWCDTNEIIHSVIHKLSISYTQSIFFSANENMPLLKLDNGIIEQVLQNILHNAILYTPADSVIQITSQYVNGNFKLHIEDDGNGIPEEMHHTVFEKFYRLSNTNRTGSGLGLSIVKGFVEVNNGTVRVLTNTKGGATFIIEIPSEASYLNNLKNE
jgi:two-component system, OmpR family, sensor histidine kinase KdpD